MFVYWRMQMTTDTKKYSEMSKERKLHEMLTWKIASSEFSSSLQYNFSINQQ